MSKISLQPNASGTGTFTLAAPDSNTNRTLTLPDEAGVVLTDTSDIETQVKTATNATGSAPVYACRAWVNFDGTGTVSIRASGNVSSITDNNTGDYTINFSTSMPDTNYSANANAIGNANFNNFQSYVVEYGTKAIGSFRIGTNADRAGSREDVEFLDLAIFR